MDPVRVLGLAFGTVVLMALIQAGTPDLVPLGTVTFLIMAAALGAASGAVFALVAQRAPADQVGAVTGVVGAAGGLGGFVPPLVMGSLYGSLGGYTYGFVGLAVVAAGVLALTVTVVRHAGGARLVPVEHARI